MSTAARSELNALLLFNTLCLTAMMAIVPVIGPIIRELQLSEWHGGLVVTASGVLWMLMARVWGRRSDRRGRRTVLLQAAAGYLVSYLLLAGCLDYMLDEPPAAWLTLSVMILFRGLVGAFYAALPSVSAARVADTTAPAERGGIMARLGAANALGMVLGPMLGGLLVQDSLILPLYVAALLPLLGMIWLARVLPKDGRHEHSDAPPVRLTDPRLRLPLAGMLLAMSGVITAQMTVGFFAMDRLALPANEAARAAGMAITAVGVTLILVQGGLSRFGSASPRLCLGVGALIAAVGFALVSLLSSVVGLVVCYCVMAMGLGLVFPAIQTLAANSVTSREQGVAAGSVTAVQGLAMVVTPLLSTLAYEVSPVLPYAASAGLLLVLAMMVGLSRRNLGMGETDDNSLANAP